MMRRGMNRMHVGDELGTVAPISPYFESRLVQVACLLFACSHTAGVGASCGKGRIAEDATKYQTQM
jgi:hypothetical protein